MGMSAVEVLEWLVKHYSSRGYKEAFGSEYDLEELLIYTAYSLKPQEIVERIEKYEAEKNHIVEANQKVDVTDTNVGNIEKEFKVGDLVRIKDDEIYTGVYKIADIDNLNHVWMSSGVVGYADFDELEHAEPPKGEKQTRADKFKELIKGTEFEHAFMHRSFSADFPETMKSWRDKDYWMEEVGKDISEEKQRVEEISFNVSKSFQWNTLRLFDKVNELVDAVNELRGV